MNTLEWFNQVAENEIKERRKTLPATERQRGYIEAMQEMSDYPFPPFTGSTSAEAMEYIRRHHRRAHENVRAYGWGDYLMDISED